MYAYFEYEDPEDLEQDVVYIETPAGFWSIEEPKQVAEYKVWHAELVKAATDRDGSCALIRAARDSA
jgi:hypothetical protein